MAKNVRALTTEELSYMYDNYRFEIIGSYLGVFCNSKKTLHDLDKTFELTTPLRRIRISKETIDLWKNEYNAYSLIEVQNAINTLIVTYQDVNKTTIEEQLRKSRLQIKALKK